MKRLFSLVFAVVVLVMSLAVPSYAAENQWIDVLDFCTPNDSGSNMIYLNSGDTVTFDFPDTEIGYIDFVLQFNTLSSPTCILKNRFGDLNLSVIKVNDYTFRFIGNPTLMYNDGIELVFQGVSSGWVEFLSFKISPLIVNSQDCPVTGFVAYGAGEEVSFYYNNWDDYSGATLYGSSNFDYDDYRAYIDILSWKKFDYIDLHVYGMELSMLSISSNIGGVNIPYEITYLTGNSAMSDLIVNITLDLTQVDRTSDEVLTVLISGDVPTLDGRIGSFTVLSSLGYVFVSGLDETLNFWYRMRNFFSDKFSSLNTWISAQTNSIVSSLAAWGQNTNDVIVILTDRLVSWGTNIKNSIDLVFVNISDWGALLDSDLHSIFENISDWGQAIIDAIVGDSSQVEQNEVIDNSVHLQEQINQELNVQLDAAVQDWNDNFDSVSGGYNTGFTKSTPSLIWLSDKAQAVFNNMGWFGNMFFFLGFLHVFFLLMSKSGLGQVFKQKNGDD